MDMGVEKIEIQEEFSKEDLKDLRDIYTLIKKIK